MNGTYGSKEDLKGVSLFCGAGGMDMGFDKAGFHVTWANDLYKDACDTYAGWSNAQVVCEDVTKIDADGIPSADFMTFGFPCFTGDSIVLSMRGYIRIDEIKVGDFVFGHDRNWHKVVRVVNQGVKPIYNLNSVGSDYIHTTENHPFYVRKCERKFDKLSHRTIKTFSELYWLNASEIVPDKHTSFYVGSPINDNSDIPSWHGVNLFNTHGGLRHVCNLDMTDGNLWYLVGQYLGNGWLRSPCSGPYRSDMNTGIVISCGKYRMNRLLQNISSRYTYTIADEGSTVKLHFCGMELAAFMKQFGHGAGKKRLPGFVFNLPVNLCSELVRGYMDSDGSVHNNKRKTSREFRITSINRGLLYDISQLVMKVYHVSCSIYHTPRPDTYVIEGRTVNQKDTYTLSFRPDNCERSSFYEDGYIWYNCKGGDFTGDSETVYDITVEDSHSFVVNNVVAHNCQGFSLSGPRKLDDSRNKLYHECVRIVTAKHPLFFVAENVKGLLSMGGGSIFEAIIADFGNCGYDVFHKLLNARDYGVPQDRQRVIIIGFRKDLCITENDFRFPEPSVQQVLLKDVLWNLPLQPSPGDICQAPYSSRYMSRNRRRGWDEVSFTIPAMAKQVPLHPSSPFMHKLGTDSWEFGLIGVTCRFSWQEAAAIQTFPTGMQFCGDLTSKYKQIGNAVPVNLAYEVAKAIELTLYGGNV